MNTSAPRIDSSYRQYTSPAENVFNVTAPSSIPSLPAISAARSGFARPENIISFFPVTIGMLPDAALDPLAPMTKLYTEFRVSRQGFFGLLDERAPARLGSDHVETAPRAGG